MIFERHRRARAFNDGYLDSQYGCVPNYPFNPTLKEDYIEGRWTGAQVNGVPFQSGPWPEPLDLHGHEGLAFPSFDEETMYLERVTVPERDHAIEIIAREGGTPEDEIDPEPIWMLYVEKDEQKPNGELHYYGFETYWWECPENAEGAVPFWKDAP